jgi:subtilisin family serine protease
MDRAPRRPRRKAVRRFILGWAEPLEDRRLLAASSTEGELLVQYEAGISAAARESIRIDLGGTLAELIDTVTMQQLGAGPVERVTLGAGMSIEQGIATLRGRPGVASVEPNWTIDVAATSNDPLFTGGRLWGMSGDEPAAGGGSNPYGSQAAPAWEAGFTGSRSVVVGIVDKGIDINHRDLRGNIWVNPYEIVGDGIDNDGNGYTDDIHGWDFAANDSSVYDGADDDHGTHVAGTIGASGGNGQGVAGVNWNVTLIAAKFIGRRSGSTANAIKAIDYLTDLKIRHGINLVVSNHSWSTNVGSAALQSAISRHVGAGILVVASAGNDAADVDRQPRYPQGYSTLAPAAFDGVISVAAISSAGQLASFSNYGLQSVDIGAPGAGIQSTLPGGRYGSLSGTSMAAPHVTGAVALYAAAHPGAAPAAIREAILSSARPTAALVGKTVTGGRLDVAAALGIPRVAGVLITGGSRSEGNAGTSSLAFTVRLTAAQAAPVTVGYATADGSAMAGQDYVAQEGTLTFAPGETTKTITVTVVGDTAHENDETFTLSLTAISPAIQVVAGVATGTIANDDPAPKPLLSITSAAAAERAGRIVFTVTLSAPSATAISVRYATANGTAAGGRSGDYAAASGTVRFAPGETSKQIIVTLRDDTTAEPHETFFVVLSQPVGAVIAAGRGTGTILDDDPPLLATRLTATGRRAR